MNLEMFLIQLFVAVIFLAVVCLHAIKKNASEAVVYGLQSFMVVCLLIVTAWSDLTWSISAIVLITLLVKVILAPLLLIQLIKRHSVKFSASSYLSLPLSLLVVSGLVLLAHSKAMLPLTELAVDNQTSMVLALAAILASIFLMVNRKGALSQIIGILSLENSIVACGILAGLEQSAILQVGVLFNIVTWFVIANVFLSMMYKHTGSLDVTVMKKLKD